MPPLVFQKLRHLPEEPGGPPQGRNQGRVQTAAQVGNQVVTDPVAIVSEVPVTGILPVRLPPAFEEVQDFSPVPLQQRADHADRARFRFARDEFPRREDPRQSRGPGTARQLQQKGLGLILEVVPRGHDGPALRCDPGEKPIADPSGTILEIHPRPVLQWSRPDVNWDLQLPAERFYEVCVRVGLGASKAVVHVKDRQRQPPLAAQFLEDQEQGHRVGSARNRAQHRITRLQQRKPFDGIPDCRNEEVHRGTRRRPRPGSRETGREGVLLLKERCS